MGHRKLPAIKGRVAWGICTLLCATLVQAQDARRLSDWLLREPAAFQADAYSPGLSWRVPAEIPPQFTARQALLDWLSGAARTANPDAARRLHEWLAGLPVTGRVPVPSADGRWLLANPGRDPWLLPGHTVVMPSRPRSVTVVTERGTQCTVQHAPGRAAIDYVAACSPGGAPGADWAWVAQPDGRTQRFGSAAWNREKQDPPAPGAWIWAPPRDGGWPQAFSEQLIRFLATQGPAPDIPAAAAQESAHMHGHAPLPAPARNAPARGLTITEGDWGGAGLLQTPSARMHKAGHFAFTLSRVYPYTRGTIVVQPFDWMEAGLRYSDISNVPYGPQNFSGDQSYKDKSLDLKIRLLEESPWLPQVALGLRDISGTGLFGSEYFVANKRWGPLDFSLGLGWGYVGGRGNIRNPLGFLGRADVRPRFAGTGQFTMDSYFSGPAAFFGGVQYQTPWEKLILKLEYDGNAYQREPFGNNQPVRSPWNFGAVYRLRPYADLSMGIERGNTLMLSLTLHSELATLGVPKFLDAPQLPVAVDRPGRAPTWANTQRDLKAQTDWNVARIAQHGRELRVEVEDAQATDWRYRVDRAASVLHRDAPAEVDRFTLAYRNRGVAVSEHQIDRDAWVAQKTQVLPPRDRREPVIGQAPRPAAADAQVLYQGEPPRFEGGLRPHYQQNIGGPDGFVLYQFGVAGDVRFHVRNDTWLQGTLELGLIDNFEKFRLQSDSVLPNVRTRLREYMTTSALTMPNLQATHVGRINQNNYYSVYGGYLESMFAGVGGEWLYRPFGSRVALGIDANAVQQRGYAQDFSLRDYKVLTGHATLYWDTGWNDVLATVSAGRYLAGDIGGTVNLSRTFGNGVSVGVFATKTNVSSAQFGEGSFDKGLYISIPFDAILPKSTGRFWNTVWRPVTRDGGAMLGRYVSLHALTGARSERVLKQRAPVQNEFAIPADRRDGWSPPPPGPVSHTRVTPKMPAAQWQAEPQRHEQRQVEALYAQGFRNITVSLDDTRRIVIVASNEQIRPLSRAAGRAARTALNLGPLDVREIRVTLHEGGGPAVRYDFTDVAKLGRVFSGELDAEAIADTVLVEYPNPTARQRDPLERISDLDAAVEKRSLVDVVLPDTRIPGRVLDDVLRAADKAKDVDWLRAGALGAGLVWLTSKADTRLDRFAKDHAANEGVKAGIKVGNAIPWLAMGGAALAAWDSSDPVRSRTGYAALEAGGVAVLAATGLKYMVGRARPGAGPDNMSFKPFSATKGHDAFPSRHVITAWAVVTPFAEEYNAPWLYGVAALTNLARTGSREHWFSDTVGASLLGWGIGKLFYESSRAPHRDRPRVMLSPSGVQLGWTLQ